MLGTELSSPVAPSEDRSLSSLKAANSFSASVLNRPSSAELHHKLSFRSWRSCADEKSKKIVMDLDENETDRRGWSFSRESRRGGYAEPKETHQTL